MRNPSQDPVPSQSGNDIPELTDIHVHSLLENDPGGIDVVGIVSHELIVDNRRKQVVGSGYSMDVSCEMQIYVPHGVNLGVPASGCPSLDSERGSDGRLPQSSDDFLAEPSETLDETNRGDGLPFSCRGGGDGGDHYQLALLPAADTVELVQRNLGDVSAVGLDVVFGQTDGGGDVPDVLHLG